MGVDMQNDEQAIRQLVATWMEATKKGDIDTLLDLMSDDAVFLMPGRAPMSKFEFETTSRAQAGRDAPLIEGGSEIQEIKIMGDWAYMWTKLTVVVTPPGGAASMTRAGHTLSILKRQEGKWTLLRDANMLAPV